jgi:hypothetical protein
MSVDRRFREGLEQNADVPQLPLDEMLTTIVRRATRRKRVRRVAWSGAVAIGLAAALVLGPRALDLLRELGRPPTPATPIPTSSPAPQTHPNPLGGVSLDGNAILPGTYRTRMHPKATFTLGQGWIGFVNNRGWLNLGYGSLGRSADFVIMRLTRVEAVGGPDAGSLVPAPDNLADWIARHPGLTAVSPLHAVVVGGLAAEQVDVLAGDQNVGFGPIPGSGGSGVGAGICANCMVRVISVVVRGRPVLVMWGGSPARFRETVGQMQSILATISFS